MSKPARHVICLTCHVGQEQTVKNTFLGFPGFSCESCSARSEYPLSHTYVAIYCVSLFLALVPLLTGRGSAGCFLVLALAAVPALAWHARAVKRQRIAEANEKGRGEKIAETFR